MPSRYARLLDDEPIPSSYLSLTAGRADERDGRLVVYGLTDRKARWSVSKCEGDPEKYTGTAHCVAPSGG